LKWSALKYADKNLYAREAQHQEFEMMSCLSRLGKQVIRFHL